VKENVTELRKAILQLAVMGRLVPQNPNDQPASELLKEIAAEKVRLIKEGKLKPQKPLPPIDPKEIPHQLPNGWEWVRLQNAFDVRDGTHDTPKYTVSGFPLITSKNLYTGRLSFEDVKFISEHDHNRIKERSRVDLGDILFAMIGSIGNPVIVECEHEFSIKNVALFKFYKTNTPERLFLHNFLLSSQSAMKAISSGAVQSFVSLNFIRNYLFPLPPLAEQKRIVVRVEQLMALCDGLEQSIAAADGSRAALLVSLIGNV
jgi:type I restriction enzyme S subunit